MFTLSQIKYQLEQHTVAGHIYEHQQILVLQEPLNPDGSTFNMFIQHDQTADQLGLQFAIELQDQQLNFLMGVTHSNQDRSYEISPGNLKGDQKAFNLCYAFYNYPKAFYLCRCTLEASDAEFEQALKAQLFDRPALAFLNTALKTDQQGHPQYWMKRQINDLAQQVKQRLQTAILPA